MAHDVADREVGHFPFEHGSGRKFIESQDLLATLAHPMWGKVAQIAMWVELDSDSRQAVEAGSVFERDDIIGALGADT